MILLACLLTWGWTQSAWSQVRIVTPQKEAELRAALPRVDDRRLMEIFRHERLLLWTEAEMPRAYQHADAGLAIAFGGRNAGLGRDTNATFLWAGYNLSGNPIEAAKGHGRGGNANIEFPWRAPGGTDTSFNAGESDSFKFLLLPARGEREVWPVVYQAQILRGNTAALNQGLIWFFPVGTVLGEVLHLKDSRGQQHVYEVRIRERRPDFWDVDVLRPFPEHEDLARRLEQFGYDELAADIRRPRVVESRQMTDTLHRRVAFNRTSGVDPLPDLSEMLAAKLLDETPFRSALGSEWRKGTNNVVAHAPTTRQAFNIVPRNYQGGFLGVEHESCSGCHVHSMVHVDQFDSTRDWYGFVRGSADGVLSWHPIDPKAIGVVGEKRRPEFRPEFLRGGMLEAYDSQRHPPSVYTSLPKQ